MKLLLIEDNATMQTTLRRAFERRRGADMDRPAQRAGQRLGAFRRAVHQRQMRAAGIEQGGGDGARRTPRAQQHGRLAQDADTLDAGRRPE